MIDYNKAKVRAQITLDDVFSLLTEWGGEPQMSSFGIISQTICHNKPGEGSKKLYFYSNTSLFKCFTGCQDIFDIFELTMKVFRIQHNQEIDLNDAVRYLANKFGIDGEQVESGEEGEDWKILGGYERIDEKVYEEDAKLELTPYDSNILKCFNYNVKISPWLEEGISQEILDLAHIGYYPGGEQITIPHFDANGQMVGLRGRALCLEEASKFGKYRPIKLNGILYNHPIGFSLYGLNWAKNNIGRVKKAIVFEAEKSVLKYMSYFGVDNDIAVACCGSNITLAQINMLIEAGAEEIVIALDRQFQEIGDNEWKHLTKNLYKINEKFNKNVLVSFIFDKNMITPYKASPVDEGPEIFIQLFNERVTV